MTTATLCKHHFLLDMPNGPQSRGVCKFCGTVRYFGNVLDDVLKEASGYGRNYGHVPAAEVADEIKQQYLGHRIADL